MSKLEQIPEEIKGEAEEDYVFTSADFEEKGTELKEQQKKLGEDNCYVCKTVTNDMVCECCGHFFCQDCANVFDDMLINALNYDECPCNKKKKGKECYTPEEIQKLMDVHNKRTAAWANKKLDRREAEIKERQKKLDSKLRSIKKKRSE